MEKRRHTIRSGTRRLGMATVSHFRDHGAALAALLALTLWLTWPLPLRMGSALSSNPDSLLNHWTLAWSFHILPRAPLSLFDANIFFPRPDTLAYSEHLFGVTLLAYPVYLASGNTILAYNFALAASFLLSGLGMYLLVRDLTGSQWGAVFAGIAYMAAPFRFLQIFHVQLLSAQWFPLIFLFLYRYLCQGRTRQLVAVCGFILLQALSCNYYALYLALALAVFGLIVLAFSWRIKQLVTPRKAVSLTVAAFIVLLLAAPFALPYLRNEQRGFYRRYEDVVQFSAHPSDYLRPTSFNKVPHAVYLPSQERSEKALFPGLAVVVLAVIGLLTMRGIRAEYRRLMAYFFASLLLVAFVLSLGPQIDVGGETYHLPYRTLYRHVPGFGGMRAPARLAILVLLSLGVLAGGGLAWLLQRGNRLRPWLGSIALAVACFEYQTYSLDRAFPPAPSIPPIYQWLADLPVENGVLELPIYEDITREAVRLHNSTRHWKPLANGFSGWWPNDYWILVGRMRYFPTSGGLRFLGEEVPVRFILIHYDEYPPALGRRVERNMERYQEVMPVRARLGSDVIYELLRSETRSEDP